MSRARLQKILARAGVSSRRAAERLITEGRVRVNGRIVKELGQQADTQHDRVEVDGKRVVAEHPVYYLLHKPREVVTTLADPEGRESVADLMKAVSERIFPVGRLDYHTSGALLMTNDGEMAQALLHPRKQVPKVYVAKVKGAVPLKSLQALREGVVLDGGEKTKRADVFVTQEEGGNTWLQLTITEGKNRQVHRMVEALGQRVQRLFRLSFAELTVDGLRPGQHRELSDSEVAKLKRDYLNPSKKDKYEQARARRRARQAERAEELLPEPVEGELAEIDEPPIERAPAARAQPARGPDPRTAKFRGRRSAARPRPQPNAGIPSPNNARHTKRTDRNAKRQTPDAAAPTPKKRRAPHPSQHTRRRRKTG